MKLKLATLTSEEDAAWDFAFAMYADPLDEKKDNQAAEMAWKDLQEEFPRLKQYTGCKP